MYFVTGKLNPALLRDGDILQQVFDFLQMSVLRADRRQWTIDLKYGLLFAIKISLDGVFSNVPLLL